jgi:calreticulin
MRIAVASILSLFASLTAAKVYFEERFDDKTVLGTHWKVPKAGLKNRDGEEIPLGKWEIFEETLKTTENSRFYEISSKLPDSFTNKDKDLVVQLTVRHAQGIDCGGGYVKLLGKDLDQDKFNGDTPYLLMFGPDVCGPTRKVHVIWTYKGKHYLIKKDISVPLDTVTHLYTLIVKPDQTYEVHIDQEKVAFGALVEDWDILPAKTIKDPKATKPESWDDEAEFDDKDDKKPDDWDEDEPEFIADSEAKKPEDWDDEMDGEWKPPKKRNPLHKGKWKPRKIKNPNYQGTWTAPMIDNPEYFVDDQIYMLKGVSAVGFDLWQVKSGTRFDNILITDDIEYAKKVGDEEWAPLYKKEKAEVEEEQRLRKAEMEKHHQAQAGTAAKKDEEEAVEAKDKKNNADLEADADDEDDEVSIKVGKEEL